MIPVDRDIVLIKGLQYRKVYRLRSPGAVPGRPPWGAPLDLTGQRAWFGLRVPQGVLILEKNVDLDATGEVEVLFTDAETADLDFNRAAWYLDIGLLDGTARERYIAGEARLWT